MYSVVAEMLLVLLLERTVIDEQNEPPFIRFQERVGMR